MMPKPLKRTRSESGLSEAAGPRSVRPKVVQTEEIPEDEEALALSLVAQQNQELGREMRGYRRRVKQLENTVARQESASTEYEGAVACLSQHWSQLEETLKSVLEASETSDGSDAALAPSGPTGSLLEQLLFPSLAIAGKDATAALPRPSVNLLDVYEKQAAEGKVVGEGETVATDAEDELELEAATWLRALTAPGAAPEAAPEAKPFPQRLLARADATKQLLVRVLAKVPLDADAASRVGASLAETQPLRARVQLFESRLGVAHRRLLALRRQLVEVSLDRKRAWRCVDDLWWDLHGTGRPKPEVTENGTTPTPVEGRGGNTAERNHGAARPDASTNGIDAHIEATENAAVLTTLRGELQQVFAQRDELATALSAAQVEAAQARATRPPGGVPIYDNAAVREMENRMADLAAEGIRFRDEAQAAVRREAENEKGADRTLEAATLTFQKEIQKLSEALAAAESRTAAQSVKLRHLEESTESNANLLRQLQQSNANYTSLEEVLKGAREAGGRHKKLAANREKRLKAALATLAQLQDPGSTQTEAERGDAAAAAEIGTLRGENEELTSVNEMLMAEVESVTQACDSFKGKVGFLETQLTQAEASKTQFASQLATAVSLKEEVAATVTKLRSDLEGLGAWRGEWEAAQKSYATTLASQRDALVSAHEATIEAEKTHEAAVTEATQLRLSTKVHIERASALEMELGVLRPTVASLRAANASAEKDRAELRAEVSRLEASMEKRIRKAVKQEQRAAAATASTTPRDDEADDELRVLRFALQKQKQKFTCPICNANERDTLIVRCGHCFCASCVDDSIKNRSRKCMSCKQPFGASDIVKLYLSG